jgi:transposase, IS5 family
VQGKMKLPRKKCASSPKYVSPSQTILPGFETPFSQKLDPNNRWIRLSKRIPWDKIASVYNKQMSSSSEGRPALSARLVVGALFIKHINNWDDRETILQIQENMYLQYFLGYSSFTTEAIFDPSLFVDIRKRMGDTELNLINEEIVRLHQEYSPPKDVVSKSSKNDKKSDDTNHTSTSNTAATPILSEATITHQGRMITDATACPQDIAFPTDLKLLNDAREKSEYLIDILYSLRVYERNKPRTYRESARKEYINIAKKKNNSKKAIRKAIGKQLSFLKRNIKSIHALLDAYEKKQIDFPIEKKQMRYFWIIQTLYQQQQLMHTTYTHTVEDRIVSIHQPHVRPIVRGKVNAKVEFGAKINVTIASGFAFLDDLSWNAFNEGTRLLNYVERYKTRFGFYPKEVLADQIYCNRENRKQLKILGIKLLAKPLGRPIAGALKEYVRPGERNPVEGKIGQGKNAYGLGRIKARLKDTSQSWIASIILVLNLVKLAGLALYCLLNHILEIFIRSTDIIYEVYQPKLFIVIPNNERWQV